MERSGTRASPERSAGLRPKAGDGSERSAEPGPEGPRPSAARPFSPERAALRIPDKAIDLIDEAGSRMRIRRMTAPPDLREFD
ncbi:hypothetical protein ABT084_36335, partial [Streptomyces sp. NPDC002138]|uniref:hypothetical protein n=1 Tax=Streptomyces sp. NPDC002138 TaxID=3154410 RepID=UPI00331BFC4B